MKHSQQTGSAHAVIIICLVAALLCALGIAFYQNFIIDKNTSTNSTATTHTTTSTPAATVTMKEFCGKYEKICFDYPSNWSVEAASNDGTDGKSNMPYDFVTVKDDKGGSALTLRSGIDGIGGACPRDEMAGQTAEVVSTYQTKITVPAQYINTDYNLAIISAAEVIIKNDKGYTAQMYLSNAKTTSEVKAGMHACDVYMTNFIYGKTNIIPTTSNPAAMTFNSGPAFGGADTLTVYGSRTEATNYFATDAAKKAYEILKSVHYK